MLQLIPLTSPSPSKHEGEPVVASKGCLVENMAASVERAPDINIKRAHSRIKNTTICTIQMIPRIVKR